MFGKMQLKKGPGVMKCQDCIKRGPEVVRAELADRAFSEESARRLEAESAAGRELWEANRARDDVVTLDSGLQYKVLERGSGKFHPTASSRCECHYTGKLLDGTQFDSSVKEASDGPRLIQPSVFAPEDVLEGWMEAMQMMVEGDRWELYVPPDLGYGPRGSAPKIPGGATLVFDLELSKIRGGKVERRDP